MLTIFLVLLCFWVGSNPKCLPNNIIVSKMLPLGHQLHRKHVMQRIQRFVGYNLQSVEILLQAIEPSSKWRTIWIEKQFVFVAKEVVQLTIYQSSQQVLCSLRQHFGKDWWSNRKTQGAIHNITGFLPPLYFLQEMVRNGNKIGQITFSCDKNIQPNYENFSVNIRKNWSTCI